MPKSKNTHSRPNFDPGAPSSRGGHGYGHADARKAGAKKGRPAAGSRSPGHRGYRPEPDAEGGQKRRWSSAEKAARHGQAGGRGRDERGGYDRDGRAGYDRGDRGDRGERGGRGGYDRQDRGGYDRGGQDRGGQDRGGYDRSARTGRDGYRASGRGESDRGDRGGYDRGVGSTGRGEYDRGNRSGRYQRGSRSEQDARRGGNAGRDGGDPRFGRYDRPRYDRDERRDRGGYDRDDSRRRGASSYGRARDEHRDNRGGYERDTRAGYQRDDRDDRPEYGARRTHAARGAEGTHGPRAHRHEAGSGRPRTEQPRLERSHRGWERDRGERPRGQWDHDNRPSQRHDRDDHVIHEHGFAPREDVVLERLQAEALEASEAEGLTFADLGLGGNIVRTLGELGATAPFPIQAATIPDILAGKDVLGRGRTGSGKTIAFGASVVENLLRTWAEGGKSGGKRQIGRAPRALILAPTRELALQIDRTVQPIARGVGLFTTQIYGGVPQHRQVGALQRGVDIVIGTPGRIEDLIEQGRLDLSAVEITVLDEADLMCDLGFLEPVQRIIRRTAENGQRLLFSATLDTAVASLVEEFLVDPAVHEVAGENQESGTIDHHVFLIDHRDKRQLIESLADRDGKILIFARTRAFAEELAEQLDDAGVRASSLHGDLNQAKRTRNLERLTSGRVQVLVATDVAARGIHVDDIDLVIQADAPDEYKSYLHRSGRTGRAGKHGTVVTLVPRKRQRRMAELLERAEIDATWTPVRPGDDLAAALA